MWYKTWIKKIGNLFQQINNYLSAFWERIRWRIAGTLVYLSFRLIRFSGTLKNLIIKGRRQLQIDGNMAKHGTLFLSFSLILIGVKLKDNNPSIGITPNPPENWSSMFRAIASITIFILIIIFMWIWQKRKLRESLKRQFRYLIILIICLFLFLALWLFPPISASGYVVLGYISLAISIIFMIAVFWKWIAVKLTEFLEGQFQYLYWVIFWTVYIIGWMKGISNIPSQEIAWPFLVGFAWFIIIGIILLRSSWQTGRRS
jgi:hypothetical protein